MQNETVIGADRRPGILARLLGTRLTKAREAAGLSYDEAAALLGREADWLVRVETGFAAAAPEEVARILKEYGLRDARAEVMIDLARRVADSPPWLTPHATGLSAASRDVYLVEAESTLAQVHGFMLIPSLAQTEDYCREVARRRPSGGRDAGQDWDLLSHRQAHRPAGVTRLLDIIIDESAIERFQVPAIMAGQLGHLLALAGAPHATVRVIARGAPFWQQRGHDFDVLSFAGTTDRIGVFHYPVTGADFVPGDEAHEIWTRIEQIAASPAQSRDILERHLAALS